MNQNPKINIQANNQGDVLPNVSHYSQENPKIDNNLNTLAPKSSKYSLQMPDILSAVYDFVREFSDLPAENIFLAYENRAFLPPKSNDYALISLLNTQSHGTSTQNLLINEVCNESCGEAFLEISELREAQVLLELFSSSPKRLLLAEQIKLSFASPQAFKFWAEKELTPLYLSQEQSSVQTDQSKQYSQAQSQILHLSYYSKLIGPIQYFDKVKPNIENIDVHHPKG